MTRLAGSLLLFGAVAAALFLFLVKHDVRQMEADLRETERDIQRQREAIQVLETEWSFLNRPGRIAELAARHLDLGPVAPEQVVTLDDLPRRRPEQQAAVPQSGLARAAVSGATQ